MDYADRMKILDDIFDKKREQYKDDILEIRLWLQYAYGIMSGYLAFEDVNHERFDLLVKALERY